MPMGKQRGKQPQLGAFSIGVANDQSSECIFITLAVPKIIDLPCIGPTKIETVGVAAASFVVPWILWLGRRTLRRIQQRIIKEKKADAENNKPEKPESPVKAKKWESKSVTLDDFMSKQICPARQQLRKVEDPDTVEKRQEKRNRIKKEQTKKPKGPLGLSAELLQNSRTSLRRAPDAPLVSYLKEDRDRSIDDGLRILEGYMKDDVKSHAQFVSNGENASEEDHAKNKENDARFDVE